MIEKHFSSGKAELVGAGAGERIIDIGYGGDSPFDGDLLSGQSGWISRAVPMFVMRHGDGGRQAHDGRTGHADDARAHFCVTFDDLRAIAFVGQRNHLAKAAVFPHQRQLARIESAGFEEDGVGDADFPHVVQLCSQFQDFHLPVVESQLRAMMAA